MGSVAIGVCEVLGSDTFGMPERKGDVNEVIFSSLEAVDKDGDR